MHGFEELTLIILVVSIVSIIIHYLRQPLIIGYILSGVLVGKYVLNIVTDYSGLELFSKLGIVILLFTIGLNLNPNTLKEVGKDSVFGGLLQILVSSIFGFVLSFYLLDFNLITSIFVAIALAFSSTIIVLKILSDRGDVDKLYGKISIVILLVQDIVAAIILLVLSIFSNSNNVNQISSQSEIIIVFVIKTLILLAIYYLLSKFILKRLARIFASSQETLLLFGLGSGFVMAYVFYKFGFSLEIGALFAGVAIASSNFAKEISSRLKPIQDFFIAIFFVLIGSSLVVENFYNLLLPIIIFTIFVVLIKFIISFLITNILGHRTRTSFYSAISLTQVSEFSLIMLAIVFSYGYIDQATVSIITIVTMLSIVLSSYLMVYMDGIYNFLRNYLKKIELKKNNCKVIDKELENVDAIIFGFDRIGSEFVDVFKKMEYKYLIIDINPILVQKAIESGSSVIYGDAEDLGFLEENNIFCTNMIISTIPKFDINLFLVENYKKRNPDGVIIVIAHDVEKSKLLYDAGANYVIMPYHLGAYHAGKMLLEFRKNPDIFESQKELQLKRINGEYSIVPKKHMRSKLKNNNYI